MIKRLNLSQKVLMLIGACILFSIVFSFFFLHFLYKELYFNSVKESVIYQGERTAAHYHSGTLSEEIIEKIHWYNMVSEYEIIVLDEIEDLSSYFPYEVNHQALITRSDRKRLENEEFIVKDGYVEEFGREIIGAVFPVAGKSGTESYIYIYVPLADLQEVFEGSIPILLLAGSMFFMILFLAVNQIRRSLFQPLQEIRLFSKEVSRGNYSNRLQISKRDEIGELARAFNSMSESLEKQEARKKEFLANIVHELRTPLTYIGGYSQALSHQMYKSPEEAEHYVKTIERETNRVNKMIHDLIDLDVLQESMYTLKTEPIAIAQLFLDTFALFEIRLHEKNLQTKLHLHEDLVIMGDPKRIQQVFYNLIDNAIKYAEEGSVIQISFSEEKNRFHFRIHNIGSELSEQDLAHIGERFFRTDKARSRLTGGTGLGLSIVKEIVRLHEGELRIESDASSGTAVTVILPSLL
ncbi:HAMP domain-containing sensor histidine kinase [Bacillus sp. FSL H8-0547]